MYVFFNHFCLPIIECSCGTLLLTDVRCFAAPLNQVFLAYAMFGRGHIGTDVHPCAIRMNGKVFAKLIREAGVLGRGLDATRVDLCYAKCCDKVCNLLIHRMHS